MTETEAQRFKGLLAGWKNMSESFKKKGDHASARLVDYCITDLKVLLNITENPTIRIEVATNRYPADYVEEKLPYVLIELRYRKNNKFSRERAGEIAENIRNLIAGRVDAYDISD